MAKFIEDFKAVSEKYNRSAEEWLRRKAEIKTRLAELEQELNEYMMYEALNLKPHAKSQTAEKEFDQLIAELPKVDQKLALVSRGKRQALMQMIPGARQYRDSLKQKIEEEYNKAEKELLEMKAQYLQKVQELGEIAAKARRVNSDYEALKQEAGDGTREILSIKEPSLAPNPAYFGEEKASQMGYSVAEWEVIKAYNKQLPKWAQEFLKGTK